MATAPVSDMRSIANYIEQHSDEKLTLDTLGKLAGLSPSGLQRVFKKTFGVTPRVYQDALRMRRYKQSLREERNVTEAIYASGYGSGSRIYGEPSRNLGMTPRVYRQGGAGEIISFACRTTVLGLLLMAATDTGVCFAQFGENRASLVASLRSEFPKADLRESSARDAPELDAWINALNQHIAQGVPGPDLPLDIRGTAFQIQVWTFLRSIPAGEIRSYTEVANAIGKPTAVRAVASACARNRIGVLIPCHRVLRSDGGLGGYRWGLSRKRALLEMEKA